MNRATMICLISDDHNVKISHPNFSSDEYIYSKKNGNVYTKEDSLFEDWYSEGVGQHNGIRMRNCGKWKDGWYIKN